MIAALVLALILPAWIAAQIVVGVVPDAPLVADTKYGRGVLAHRTPSPERKCQVTADSAAWPRMLKISTDSAIKSEPGAVLVLAEAVFIPAMYSSAMSKNCKNASIAPLDRKEKERWGVWEAQDMEHLRIVSIGDVHGDAAMLQRTLWMARVVDDKGHWQANKTHLVQTGDLIDRGQDTFKVVEFFERLKPEAKAAGGQVTVTLGNHEVMNMCHDFRYVAPEERDNKERYEAFSPHGKLAKILHNYPICTQVEGTVFVHGGIVPEFAKLGVDGLNALAAKTLVSYTSRRWEGEKVEMPLYESEGPVWNRFYARDGDPCQVLRESLALLKAKRMVVGHTIQEDYLVHSRCEGALILQDVAMSQAMGKGHVGALEMRGTKAMALDGHGWRSLVT